LYFNARSLGNKLNSLFPILASYKFHLIAITETWLTEKYPDALLTFGLNYTIFRCDRVAKPGGGVCLLVQNCLSFSPVCSINVCNSSFLSVDLADTITLSGLRISVAYVPPSATTEEVSALCDTAAEYLTNNYEQILLGDFNLPNAFSANTDAILCPSEREFKSFCDASNLLQLVNKPTRDKSLLDLILVSDTLAETVNNCTVLEPFSTSDHCSIEMCFSMPLMPCTRERFHDFRRADFPGINRFLLSIHWTDLFSRCNTIDEALLEFNGILQHAVSLFVPIRTRKLHIHQMPEYIRKLADYRSLLWKEIACPIARRKFCNASKKLSKLMLKFMQNKEKLILAKNPNNIYKYVSNQLSNKGQKLPAFSVNGKTVTDNAVKCELFADYFHSCYNANDCTENPISLHFSSHNDVLRSFNITPLEVFDMLERCPSKVNTSPDSIPFILLRNCSATLTFPVFYLFNKSITTGIVPKCWKESLVVPIPKKGDKKDYKNYRPISLTCSLARLLEKHVSRTLLAYWDQHSVLPQSQHGFRKNMSTTTQLIECHDQWSSSLDSRDVLDVLYVDFKKAFDVVPIPRLLLKIAASNITDKALDWLQSFLDSRTFSVKVEQSVSSKRPCISGIPAGTCIGPLLFIFYIADLPFECDTDDVQSVLFADDLKASAVDPDSTPRPLQVYLGRLDVYGNANGLDLAINKCYVLHIGLSNPRLEYTCHDVPLLSTTEPVRDLGVYMTSDLCFKEHIKSIVSSASRRLFCLLKAVRCRDPVLLAKLFNVYVRPILEYCSPVFNPTSVMLIDELEKVQRRASRLILARTSPALRDLPFLERYKLLGMHTLEYRRLFADLVLLHKYLLGKVKINTNSIQYYLSVRGDKPKLRCHRARTQVRSSSFFPRVVKVYSKLPDNIVTINTVSGFRRALLSADFRRFATFRVS
jgi:hypothetical protein